MIKRRPQAHFDDDVSRRMRLTWDIAPEVLTVEEAAVLARVPRNAMYEAVRLGIVPAANFGHRRTRIAKVELAKVFAPDVELPSLTAASNHLPEA